MAVMGKALWKDVLVAKYGGHILYNDDWSNDRIPTTASKWWKDICSIDKVVASKNWNLFQWEEDLVARLRELLETVNLSLQDDHWRWIPDPTRIFSVNSSYNYLLEALWSEDDLDEEVAVVFEQNWESPAPSKVIAFSWQLFHDRIPTRRNLDVGGLLGRDAPWECVGCVGSVESSLHLFLHCPCAMRGSGEKCEGAQRLLDDMACNTLVHLEAMRMSKRSILLAMSPRFKFRGAVGTTTLEESGFVASVTATVAIAL
ncbi:F-box family protein, partial [Trifolium medium]|nr:F-box family protein [Trifolium medium]